MKRLIFTDLDGTLLDHHDYSFEEALEAIAKLKEHNIPLVFTTSKTKSEVEKLQRDIGISEPFIVENGAALFIPKDYQDFDFSNLEMQDDKHIITFGEPYQKILDFYQQYKEKFMMVGFSDLSTEVVSNAIGLSKAEAKLAKQRGFTEPFILQNESILGELETLANDHQLKITKGGRFYHIIGKNQDKGVAVKATIELFKKLYDDEVESVALGDSENDLPMLASVNFPIIIQKYNQTYLEIALDNVQRSNYPGSKGWNEMVLKYVK